MTPCHIPDLNPQIQDNLALFHSFTVRHTHQCYSQVVINTVHILSLITINTLNYKL